MPRKPSGIKGSSIRIKAPTLDRLRAELDLLTARFYKGESNIPCHDLHGVTCDTWVNAMLDRCEEHRARAARSRASKPQKGRKAKGQAKPR